MKVVLNGAQHELDDGASVLAAVEATGVGSADATRGLAVAVDGDVLPRRDWDATTLHDGQRVEVLRAVQGG